MSHVCTHATRIHTCHTLQNSVPYSIIKGDIGKGKTRSPDIKALNHRGNLPFIPHDGFILDESHLILKYLHAVFGGAGHWYPSDLRARARDDASIPALKEVRAA